MTSLINETDFDDMREFESMYFTPDEFLNHQKSINNPFSLLHINCRSFLRHCEDILLLSCEYLFNVVAFSETWSDGDKRSEITINGYNIESKTRTGKRGGRVALALKQNIKYVVRDDLSVFNNYCESLFIEIIKPGKMYLLVFFIDHLNSPR